MAWFRFALFLLLPLATAQGGKLPDFSFIHISDLHIDFKFTEQARQERGAATFPWLKKLIPSLRKPSPSFAVVSGDITEFGVPGVTWQAVENLLEPLGIPWYAVCGNHDNTWTAMGQVMRQRHGGWNYSFSRFNCHFVVLNSATIQEPIPCLGYGTLSWLKQDLAKLQSGRPVFIFMHHPPSSREFAQPAQARQFSAVIDPYNVVMIGFGHGHAPTHQLFGGGIDCVQGGTTFAGRKHDNRGCNLISVKAGVLKVEYHYTVKGKKPLLLLNKKIARLKKKASPFTIKTPTRDKEITGKNLVIRLETRFRNPPHGGPELLTMVDGKFVSVRWQGKGTKWLGTMSLKNLEPGAHLLSVSEANAGGWQRQDSVTFYLAGGALPRRWGCQLDAGVKAAPVVTGNRLYVATLAGTIYAFNRISGNPCWKRNAGAEILTTPLVLDNRVIIGSGNGQVICFNPAGKILWRYNAGAPVYAAARAVGDTIYFGDNAGCFHAINATDGKQKWCFTRARFAIESAPATTTDKIFFGAWDGYLYALNRKTGKLLWKQLGPRARKGAARYYAPADCSPVVLGERIYVADRGYSLGAFDMRGELIQTFPGKTAAIRAKSGAIYLRGVDHELTSMTADGKITWCSKIPLGRFPIPPTIAANRIFTCSNRGMVTVLSRTKGKVISSRQVTPGTYVMAPITATDDGLLYIAGMDGSLTALRTR